MARKLEDKHPGYFEAVLQLRDVLQEVRTYAEDEIIRVRMNVAKAVELKNGVDYYLSDNSLTRALGKRMQEKFGGYREESASLWGVKKDREVYRVTVLFRGVPFKKGDLVEFAGEDYIVRNVSKDIFLQNVKSGTKVHVTYKDMKQIRKKD
ncbi:hypothetical protein HOC13_04195 [Candidatus Woesearchaeota archaeon]|jgi:NMD protein affecting ribosome stability and mRNA decay|nr:hypothetical protein [Candidatus Woesearchaeota archaeon]